MMIYSPSLIPGAILPSSVLLSPTVQPRMFELNINWQQERKYYSDYKISITTAMSSYTTWSNHSSVIVILELNITNIITISLAESCPSNIMNISFFFGKIALLL